MPIALDGDTVDFVLETDKAKDASVRPSFTCKYLTCREMIKFEKCLKAAVEEKDQENINILLNAAINVIVTGWKNLPEEFSTDALDTILTPSEKWDVIYGALAAVRLSESDKKKSLLKSPSTGESSVVSAPAGNALTPPATESPK